MCRSRRSCHAVGAVLWLGSETMVLLLRWQVVRVENKDPENWMESRDVHISVHLVVGCAVKQLPRFTPEVAALQC